MKDKRLGKCVIVHRFHYRKCEGANLRACCQNEQVFVGPNKLFSLTPIADVTFTNELRSKPACDIPGPTHACNLFKAGTRNGVMKRGGRWCVCVLEY